METANPYAPPQASVRDIGATPAQFQTVNVWSFKGRIGRLRFLAYSMVAYLVLMLVSAILAGLGAVMKMPGFVAFLPLLFIVPYVAVFALLTIQRSHDMDWSGWASLLAFIPIVGLIWIFRGGTAGENRFGAPPPPNTIWVKIGASILPLTVVVGILAAVTLPAYQQYVMRAKAAQVKSVQP